MNEEEGNGNGGDEDDVARPWDSCCPEAFPWDGKSSLMVCVDPEQRIWYQAHVLKQRGNQYLLSWSGESEKEKKTKDYAFWRQFNEKPSIVPGCPGPVSHLHEFMCLSLVFNDDAASAALHICCPQAAGHCHHLLLTSRS